jgi:hypothetical protein
MTKRRYKAELSRDMLHLETFGLFKVHIEEAYSLTEKGRECYAILTTSPEQ